MQKVKPITVVQGGQWGSEAKGAVAAYLCVHRRMEWAVRTGAVNAGHTVIWKGVPQKMQQLPTGWVNPQTALILGAGAFIHPAILAREIELVSTLTGEDVRKRLYIDQRASLHTEGHTEQAAKDGRHLLIGATGKGCSVAITDKIRLRGRGYILFSEWLANNPTFSSWLDHLHFADTVKMLHTAYDSGQRILLEGTQGSLLDLHLGPYPYTTHKQTQAAQWVTEAGLSPSMEYRTALVVRTYPIRVAGNSGPMTNETTWPNIARAINRKLMNNHLPQRVRTFALTEYENTLHNVAMSEKYDLPLHADGAPNYDFHKWNSGQRLGFARALSEMPAYTLSQLTADTQAELGQLFEYTTVTKKLRRVAEYTAADVQWSSMVNRPSEVFLTFFNYWYPELWDQSNIVWRPNYHESVARVAADAGCPVSHISTGPDTTHILRVPNPVEE